MASHKAQELKRAILGLSESQVWELARQEWYLDHIYETEEPGTCLCTHFPIIDHCVLLNRRNGNKAIVGNVCVKKFMGLPSDRLFDGIARIAADTERAANAAVIEHAYGKNWLSQWERGFCLSTIRKRNLSARQQEKRVEINEKILERMSWART